jgi:hypothetical protein
VLVVSNLSHVHHRQHDPKEVNDDYLHSAGCAARRSSCRWLPLHPLSQVLRSFDLEAAFSLFDVEIPAMAPGAPPTHTFEDEVYYVLEGEMTFLLGNYVETAKKTAAR